MINAPSIWPWTPHTSNAPPPPPPDTKHTPRTIELVDASSTLT